MAGEQGQGHHRTRRGRTGLGWFFGSFVVGLLVGGGMAIGQRATDPGEGSRATPAAGGESADRQAFVRAVQDGGAALSKERYSDAFLAFQRAARADPRSPIPQCGIGDVYRGLDRNELAAEAYRKAVELDPDHPKARLRLASVLCVLGRTGESIEILQRLRSEQPENVVLLGELARNYLRSGRAQDAISLLELYVKARPREPWGLARLGRACALANRPKVAEAAFRRALAVEPKGVLARLWLGQLLVAEGRRAEGDALLEEFRRLKALQVQERALERRLIRRPDDPKTLAALGWVRYQLGDYERSLRVVRSALELDPGQENLLRIEKLIEAQIAAIARARASGGAAAPGG